MPPAPALVSKALALGAGSFWGTQQLIAENFQLQFPGSIERAQVGYMHPHSPPPSHNLQQPHPTHKDVCNGTTGFVEVLYITLATPTPDIVEELFKLYFSMHDPTTKNRQGKDLGTHYASTIFCSDDYQKAIARQVRGELQAALSEGKLPHDCYEQTRVVTKIAEFGRFYPAEEEHQLYLQKNPDGYCNHYIRFEEWPRMHHTPEVPSGKLPTHRRWNRSSFFYSFTKILAQMPQEDFASAVKPPTLKRPTHRRWNRRSVYSSLSKILKDLDPVH